MDLMTLTAPAGTEAAAADRRRVWRLFTATTALTVFDAAASWLSIVHLRIAAEANGILGAIAEVIGFEGALVVRVLWGVGLSLLLAVFALRLGTPARRRLARRGLMLVTVALSALAMWHLVVLILGGEAL